MKHYWKSIYRNVRSSLGFIKLDSSNSQLTLRLIGRHRNRDIGRMKSKLLFFEIINLVNKIIKSRDCQNLLTSKLSKARIEYELNGGKEK